MRYIIFCLIFISINLRAQYNFDTRYEGETIGDWCDVSGDVCIDAQGNYYIPFFRLTFDESTPPWDGINSGGILKLNPQGDLVDTLIIDDDFYDVYMGYATALIDETIYTVVNYINSDDQTGFWKILKYDLELNLLENEVVDYEEDNLINGPLAYTLKGDTMVVMASYRNVEGTIQSGLFLLKFSSDLEYIENQYTVGANLGYGDFHDILVKPLGNYLIAGRLFGIDLVGENNYFNNIDFGEVGEDLIPFQTFAVPGKHFNNRYDIELFQDSIYFVSGEIRSDTYPESSFYERDVAVYKFDQDYNKLDSIFFTTIPIPITEEDSVDTACSKCLEINQVDEMYFASTVDLDNSLLEASSIRLVKMDTDLNVIWEKYYADNEAIVVFGIKATEDGGCVISCVANDLTIPNYLDKDLRIIKVDGDGFVSGIDDGGNLQVKSALIYPIPSDSFINIQSALKDFSLIIYNESGQMIEEFHHLFDHVTLEVNATSNGLHLYHIQDNTGKVIDSGKLIFKK